jgi:hypothetical protein
MVAIPPTPTNEPPVCLIELKVSLRICASIYEGEDCRPAQFAVLVAFFNDQFGNGMSQFFQATVVARVVNQLLDCRIISKKFAQKVLGACLPPSAGIPPLVVCDKSVPPATGRSANASCTNPSNQ